MEDLNALATFARVVDLGSFSAAAAALGVSKSAVSKQVSRLEDRLGARLLNRSTRKLSLTEAGAAFHEHCTRVVAEADAAEAAVTHMAAAPRGTLRVSAPMTFGTMHLAPALPDFLCGCPELKVELNLNDRIADLVDEGFDLAVRIGHLSDSRLVARRIASSRRMVCAAPDYWARHGRPQVPADLGAHRCLRYTLIADADDWRFRMDGRRVAVRVAGPMAANNGEALLVAAMGGLGVAALPAFIAGPALADGRLEAVLDAYEDEPLPIHAVTPHRRHPAPKVRAFIDFLKLRFGNETDWCERAPR